MITTTTLNPAQQDASTILSGGNLTVTFHSSGYALDAWAIPTVTTGKHYFEMVLPARAGATEQAIFPALLVEGGYVESPYTYTDYHLGGVIGMYFDMDAKSIGYIRPDGSLTSVTTFSWTTGSAATVIAYLYPLADSEPPGGWVATFNFGATAFAHTPPDGYVPVIGHMSFVLTCPSPILFAPPNPTMNLTSPSPTLSFYTGAPVELTAPSPLLTFYAHDSTGENAAHLTAPKPTLVAFTGAVAKLTAPSPTLSCSATVTILATANLTAPSPTLSASATVTNRITANLQYGNVNGGNYSLRAYCGAVCSVSVTGSPTLQASVTTGAVISAQVTCPLFELVATASSPNTISADLICPSPEMGRVINAWLTAPSATLVAIGTATITATYEAYAINLGHRPRGNEPPVNEVTRYTNFPFTHVVRYQNSYFGANSTGLYLLEGTTDAGTPIPWALKTAMDDFKAPVKKTVNAAYFGGRFGPASTVQLHAGEATPVTYSYSTPRDALAQNHRQVFGKGIKERYFALGASGTGTCELDTIELETYNTSRRI